ncbi:MAG: hypothetical protein ACRD4U_05615 [Candidatus Acidiferrales bacterium]
MMEFIPNHAPAVVLGFLATCLVLGVAGLVLLFAWVTKRPRRAWQALGASIVVGSLYVTLLVGAAVTSDERTLAPGEWKYFCEIDCHLAYTVTEVRAAKTLGPPEHPVSTEGIFYKVTIKTWFDERTISRRRPRDLALRPDPRLVAVVDGYGNSYAPIEVRGTPLTQPLLPGEFYATEFVFDLPADRPSFRLLLTTNDQVTWVLIGHEASLFHKKVFFALTPE